MVHLSYQKCNLCPRKCGVDRTSGVKGFCGASDYIYAARAALHMWEEPPISGINGSGTVFFSHCSLRCVFCQNREISRDREVGKAVSADHLSDIFLSLQQQGAHNINLVTGTHYVPHIAEALTLARGKGLLIPVVFNCGGYECVETLRMLNGLVDIYLPDFKYYSSYYAAKYSKAPDYYDYVIDALDEMLHQVGVPVLDSDGMMRSGMIIRHLMLPGLLGDTKQVLSKIADRYGDRVLVSLMRQYTPFDMQDYPELNRKITDEEYAEAVEWFELIGLNGFLQDAESISESFIPSFQGEGL